MAGIVPRSVIGVPEPSTSRRRLDRVGVLLAHHVGVSNTITSRYRNPANELVDAQAAASWGITSGRNWEYNYMIGLGGTIFEQAGEYMGQHCLNFNASSAGVLFLNVDELQVTAAQIEAWRWLRADMVSRGVLSPGHEVAPHYRYRTTGCPGIRAEPPGAGWVSPTGQGRLGNLIPALTHPPDPEEDDMPKPDDVYIVKPYVGATGNPPWFLVERFGGGVRYAMAEDAGNPAIKQVTAINQEQYDHLHNQVYG